MPQADTISSKVNLLGWRKGVTARAFTAMHVPDATQEWLGVDTVDVPFAHSAKSAREEAMVLLQVGAEVEHALLLQYLFAAYSMRSDATGTAATWQDTLLTIARQEMAHLITVQNLLRALRAPMHFDREDFPLHPDLYPFPVVLEAVSQQSLAKYVAAEMPSLDQIKDAKLREHVAEILKAAKVALHEDVQRVGMIYAHLYWLFRKTDEAEPGEPWADFRPNDQFSKWHIDDADFASQAAAADFSTPDEWGISDDDGREMHVDPALPRASALKALYTISAQGEGPGAQQGSHFDKFLKMYDEFAAFPGSAVYPVATNPATTKAPESGMAPETRSIITNTTTLQLAQLLDVRYEFMLLCLMRGVQESKAAPADTRLTLLAMAVTEMSQRIAVLGAALATAPLDATPPAGGNPRNAGAPFELLHGPLPTEAMAQWVRLKQLIAKSDRLLGLLGATAGTVLGTTKLDGTETRAFIDAQIAAVVNSQLPD